jgi:transposase
LIAEVVTMRRQLSDEHVAVENQAAHLDDAMLRRLAKRRLARLNADIRLLDKRLAEMVAAEPALARRYEVLASMPGVGPVLAFTLIALLPELGEMSRKRIPRHADGPVASLPYKVEYPWCRSQSKAACSRGRPQKI